MTSLQLPEPTPSTHNSKTKKVRKIPIFERVMAIIALGNFALVLFNMSYIAGRDFYFHNFPEITRKYDPIKGIEPHRDTQQYLNKIEALKNQVGETGIRSPESAEILRELQELSAEMIQQNPFQIADKSGTLEKIKNRMRDHIPNPDDSSTQAFMAFWSQEHLANQWDSQISWFEANISPLIATNYYRRIGENGEFIDGFWWIDLPFIVIFAIELLGRTYLLSRRYLTITWLEAILWRWYDLLLLIPVWRWLRVIPVGVRMSQAQLPNMEPIRSEMSRGFVATFAQELTEVVVIQILNQIQSSIRQGEVTERILESQNQPYLNINGVNEIEVIATRLIQVTIQKVLPQLQPDVEALFRYSIQSAVEKSPVFQTWHKIPGVQDFSTRLTERMVMELSKAVTEGPQSLYSGVKTAMEDPVGTKLTNQLVQNFGKHFGAELKQEHAVEEIQSLLSDLIEEIKLNYVKRISEADFDKILEETKQLEQMGRR